MNNLIVYLEIEDGFVSDVSLELLTKGRSLADELKCKLEAVAIGYQLDKIGEQVFPYGVDVLYLAKFPRFAWHYLKSNDRRAVHILYSPCAYGLLFLDVFSQACRDQKHSWFCPMGYIA